LKNKTSPTRESSQCAECVPISSAVSRFDYLRSELALCEPDDETAKEVGGAASSGNVEHWSDCNLRIEVEDNGKGVPPDIASRLFRDVFVQVESVSEITFQNKFAERQGSGLGLYVTGMFVQQMSGSCGHAIPDHGKGSVFWFEIPVLLSGSLRRPSSASTPRRMSSTGSGDQPEVEVRQAETQWQTKRRRSVEQLSGKILVVDDSTTILKMLGHSLTRHGFTVETAKNGKEAVEKMSCSTYLLVLMDFLMPILDGIGATEKHRRWEATQVDRKRQLIFGMSANAEDPDLKAAEEAGIDCFIPKPLKVQNVLEILRSKV